jgi:hypothetical protein
MINSHRRGGATAVRHKARTLSKLFAIGGAVLLVPYLALAANPTSGSVSAASQPLHWTGTASGTGSANGESTCIEGVTCDTYTLTVNGQPSDWQQALLQIKIDWAIPAHDYDLYVHKGDNNGPIVAQSAGGAPQTEEAGVVDPLSTGTGIYSVHVVYFTQVPGADQPVGTVAVMKRPQGRFAYYIRGGMTFSPNQTVACPVSDADGEPSSRTDIWGNHYVAGIRGVPAGVDLWYFDLRPSSNSFDPNMRNPIYRGQPDAFTPTDSVQVGADGGGDVDIAVGIGNSEPNNVPTLAFTSLVASNISTSRSQDLGNTFTKNPLGNVTGGAAVDDREWVAFHGPNEVYMVYRTFQPAVTQIQKSTDGGLTYGPARTAGQIGQVGSIDVDQLDGTVYVAGSSGIIAVGTPDPVLGEPLTYTNVQAANDPNGEGNLFFVVKVAPNHVVYATYSNGQHVFLISSRDHGMHWTDPVRVDNGTITATSIFPTLAVGRKPGSVAIGWYGTSNPVNDDHALWNVFVSQCFNGDAPTPTFRQAVGSDHYIHGGNISLGGTLGNANRNLLDYFQISFDRLGALVIDYTDDHNDYNGFTYVARQVSGINDVFHKLAPAQEGSELPPVQPFSLNGAQVVDFSRDVAYGLLAVLPTRDPLDIQWIKYFTRPAANNDLMLNARMNVSDLSLKGPLMTWRMNFAVNCPDSRLNPSHLYANGVSDFGDQFYLKASLDAQGNPQYVWGTAVRDSSGGLTYTDQGTADGGAFDMTNNTVTVSVLASKLTPFIKHGPAIAKGTIACGLRGSTSHASGDAKHDLTRGGICWVIGNQ